MYIDIDMQKTFYIILYLHNLIQIYLLTYLLKCIINSIIERNNKIHFSVCKYVCYCTLLLCNSMQ